MALTQITEKGIKDGEIINADINASAAIAKTKLAGLDIVNADVNASAAIAGSKLVAATTSVPGSMSAADKTKLDGVAASANNYTHPNHSGEVTSTADGATVIASDIVDEDNLKISNAGTNGQFLQKQSGNTGGLTWADAGGAWVKLSQVTNGTTVDDITFDSLDTTTYRAFKFIGGMQPETDNVELRFRMRVGGSDLSNTAYNWGFMVAYPDNDHLAKSEEGLNAIRLFDNGGNQAREGWGLELLFFPHLDGHASQIGNFITWSGYRLDGSKDFRTSTGSAHYDVDDQYVNGIKFFPSSGRFDYHNYTLYGIKA